MKNLYKSRENPLKTFNGPCKSSHYVEVHEIPIKIPLNFNDAQEWILIGFNDP